MNEKKSKTKGVNIIAIASALIVVAFIAIAASIEKTPAVASQPVTQPIASIVDPVEISMETPAAQSVVATETIAGNKNKSHSSADSIIVTINGIEVTQSQIDRIVEPRLASFVQNGQTIDEENQNKLRQNVLNEIMKQQLITMAISSSGIDITDEQINARLAEIAAGQNKTPEEFLQQAAKQGIAADQIQQKLKRGLAFDRLLETETGIKSLIISEEDAKQYYDSNIDKFTQPQRIRASHILLGTGRRDADGNPIQADQQIDAQFKSNAEQLAKEIKAGADFEEFVRKHSVCKTKNNGGDLGYFSQRSGMDEDFLEAAFNMNKGQISDVIKTQFGYHIIKMTDSIEPSTISFDRAMPEVVKWLTNQKKQALLDDYIKSLSSKAEIVWAQNL